MNKVFNLKVIIPLIVVVVIGGAAYYFYSNKNKDVTQQNSISTNNNKGVVAVVFNRNITFEAPSNITINVDSSPNSVIVLDKSITEYNPSSYQELLEKGAIIIQNFPPLNKNKQIFNNFISQKYKSTDKTTSNIDFSQVNGFEAATISVDHLKDNYKEYVVVVNLESPVIVVAAKKNAGFDKIVSTIKNISTEDQDAAQIRKQIQLVGTLIRSNMASDLYSQYSQAAKKNLTVEDLKSNLSASQEVLKGAILVNGGLWVKSKNQFICKPIFKNPDKNVKEVKNGQFVFVKEKGKWLISSLDIPKD
ncbi:MAG: hypothetical protein UT11_C0001G0009 [Berkelbacteria bacterium GW2011_GWA2_38_9]|uniref:Uncharacterized protein n=1 Tax=Berkelbacteria bacterium GW2011_GWA2_38_9 TaxID=1618334 RepID=A0A0G0NXS4_9BACT|nr:MAG: hypothetical protein UT11_C0001G0009 [Berkelbacteria bacterium GW2011_GWA2_38_9]